ncbi:U4 U6.U5 tri-snRNP-associated protein [Musa troglodytarum]|uniref:U4 U6.U5 tri-snRNP-associated protein n=1 Tax=Musa troglodytarum TaxID=320322 RepID=A0A9E7JJI4_9LILI|nr:U4 U6.U5 tri-snRNP-associated protein [Musa troglodytarum]
METPQKRKPRNGVDDEEAEALKKRRLSDGEGEEDDGSGSLPGLAQDEDDEDAEAMVRRERGNDGSNGVGEVGGGRGEALENGGHRVGGGGGDEEMQEVEDKAAAGPPAPVRQQRQVERRRDCPYLDTVNRQVLDFDFERFCSISLSNLNVYACLVCGKYYQGRGLNSHAYTHSLEAGHHVYINLQTEKVYCLPDGYEIDDPSLDDIRHVLNPRFSKEQVLHLDENRQWSRALDGSNYLPGMVGLNNIKETDFVNVTIQSLMRVTPLRNFFLIPENYQHSKSPLVHRFGELTRKIWHARNFKGQVSPHEFLQAVMKGELEVVKEIQAKLLIEKKDNDEEQYNVTVAEAGSSIDNVVREASRVPFLMLGLDLPPPPLFKDAMEKNIIPQVPLFNILKKFDGETVTEVVRPCIARMRYRVIRLPKYLILHMRRFTKNNFFIEKNPTLVNFPVKNLELKDYIPLPPPKEKKKLRSKYDLIANIVHDGKPGEGCYRVFVQRKSEELWYEMQDLHVTETLPQMVALSEAYMQIYEQQE